jgi:hypothetical protein
LTPERAAQLTYNLDPSSGKRVMFWDKKKQLALAAKNPYGEDWEVVSSIPGLTGDWGTLWGKGHLIIQRPPTGSPDYYYLWRKSDLTGETSSKAHPGKFYTLADAQQAGNEKLGQADALAMGRERAKEFFKQRRAAVKNPWW